MSTLDITTITVTPITNESLTTKELNGTGIFDVIMQALANQLQAQYENNRITGADYTKAYIELTAAGLSAGVSFLLGRDEAYWKAILAQQQALNAQLQAELIRQQTEVQHAQVSNTLMDGTTPVVGAIGKQKDLYDKQITSYTRDSEVKAAKMFVDAWITQKTLDEGLLAPTNFQNASVDAILADIKTNNNIG